MPCKRCGRLANGKGRYCLKCREIVDDELAQKRRKSGGTPGNESVRQLGTFHLLGKLAAWTDRDCTSVDLPAGDWAASLISRQDVEFLILKESKDRRLIREPRWKEVKTLLGWGKTTTLSLTPSILQGPEIFASNVRILLELKDGSLGRLQIREVGPKVQVQLATECSQVVGVRLLWKRIRPSRTKRGS